MACSFEDACAQWHTKIVSVKITKATNNPSKKQKTAIEKKLKKEWETPKDVKGKGCPKGCTCTTVPPIFTLKYKNKNKQPGTFKDKKVTIEVGGQKTNHTVTGTNSYVKKLVWGDCGDRKKKKQFAFLNIPKGTLVAMRRSSAKRRAIKRRR